MATTPATLSTTLAGGGNVPIGMRSGAAQAAVTTTASQTTTPYGFSTSTQADAIVTLVNEIRATLIAAGFMKGSS